ncbi:MAG: hypothetical protein WD335_03105 [Candidatus Paceibacterota bacterium]
MENQDTSPDTAENSRDIPHPHYDKATASPEPSTEKHHAGSLVATVAIIVLLLIGGAFAYSQLGGGVDSDSAPSFTEIMEAQGDLETIQTTLALEAVIGLDPAAFETREDAASLRQLFGSVLGISADEEIPEEITTRLTIEGNASLADDQETEVQSDVAFDVSFSVGADSLDEVIGIEFRQVAGESYVYGRALPNLAFLPLQSFAGQWIGLGESPASNFTAPNQLETDETELSDETYREIFTAVADSDVFTIEEVRQVRTDAGVDAYRYDIAVDSAAIPSLLTEIQRIIEENEPEFAASPAYGDFQQQAASYEETIARIEEVADSLSFWVAEDTLFFQRIRIDSSFTAEELRELSPQTDYTGITGIDGFIELSFSDHNEPVDISAPENARPLEEIMSGMFGGVMGGAAGEPGEFSQQATENARQDARDARRQSDMQQIRTAIELCANANDGSYESCHDAAGGELESVFIDEIPEDPSGEGPGYIIEVNQSGYCVGTNQFEGDEVPFNDSDQVCGSYTIGGGM